MTLLKRLFIAKLAFKVFLLALLAPMQAYPQTATASQAAAWNMNRALSGITQKALESRGYVATDPRTYSTLAGMSSTAGAIAGGTAATVAAITLAGVTAPAWGSILLVAGVSSLVGVLVQLGVSGLVNWMFRGDQTVDQVAQPGQFNNCASGNTLLYWDAIVGGQTVYACDGVDLARQAVHVNRPLTSGQSTAVTCVDATTVVTCTNANGSANAFRRSGTMSASCGSGTYQVGTACVPYTFTPPGTVPSATAQTLQQAVTALPETEKAKPVNPQLVAAVANTLWQQAAAQPGYAGLPYPASNPISTEEAQAWMEANPGIWPTVGDFVAPNPVTSNSPQPWAMPSNPTAPVSTPTTQPNPNATNPASQNPLTNLGPDPGTPAPTLETTPTAAQILDPVLNMLPDHRGFTAVSQTGTCPTPVIELYGRHTLDAHCVLIENNKSIIQAAAMVAWTVMALFIVLSA
ncbi:MAG: hypothetical protein C0449_14385 [Polaromonas sp.]|nr:hypothetical protein [Polaromonas sp.]